MCPALYHLVYLLVFHCINLCASSYMGIEKCSSNLFHKDWLVPHNVFEKLRDLKYTAFGVPQLSICLTLDLSSGHDLVVMGLTPASGSVLSVEPAWNSLSLPLTLPLPSLSILFSLQRNKDFFHNKSKIVVKDVIFRIL